MTTAPKLSSKIEQRRTSKGRDTALHNRVARIGPYSLQWRVRVVVVFAVLMIATFGVGLWSVMVGDYPLTAEEVIEAALAGGDAEGAFIVRTLRLPRVLTSIAVGFSLGMSGAIFQSLIRNPLGSPDIVGFQSGAAVGAVAMIILSGGSSLAVALGAVAGGLVAAIIVYLLAYRNGLSPARLVLVGIGLGFVAASAVDLMIVRADIYDVQRAAVWLTGSLNGRSWEHLWIVLTGLAVFAPLGFFAERPLNRMALGDDTASALGLALAPLRLGFVLVGVALAALPVAAAGPIGFVAFVSGPIARRLTNDPGASITTAGAVGAFVTVSADLAARRMLAPIELPVGVFTAVVGAPYLIWLLFRQGRTGEL